MLGPLSRAGPWEAAKLSPKMLATLRSAEGYESKLCTALQHLKGVEPLSRLAKRLSNMATASAGTSSGTKRAGACKSPAAMKRGKTFVE